MKIILILAILVGCTSTEHVMTPDGQDGLALTCPRSIVGCYDEAQRHCPKGYNVIDKTIGTKSTLLITCKS